MNAKKAAALASLHLDNFRFASCVSYWKARKVGGIMATFFWAHNMACEFKAQGYEKKRKQVAHRIAALTPAL